MQAEALGPLPVDKMRLAWRADKAVAGKRPVTIAAGKTDGLKQFVPTAQKCRASKILLDCEAVIKAWKVLFGGTDEKSVIINIGRTHTYLLLAEHGRLSHAVTLDTGLTDLSAQQNWQNAAELFVHDLRNTLELFGQDVQPDTGVIILSEDIQTHKRLISYLADAGINARPAVADPQLLKAAEDVCSKDIYQYIEAVGLAMLALDGDGSELNLFADLYTPAELAEAAQTSMSLKRPCIITAAMVVLFLLVSYTVDKAALAQLKKHLYSSGDNPNATNAGALIEARKMRQVIARQRPDVLDLLTKINESGPESVMLDDFTFKKHQPVTISGHAKSFDQLYEFQKTVGDKNGITDVKIQNPSLDKKKEQVSFKMAFHYKNFTKKR